MVKRIGYDEMNGLRVKINVNCLRYSQYQKWKIKPLHLGRNSKTCVAEVIKELSMYVLLLS